MGMRGRCRASLAAAAVLLAAGCGSASDPSPPTGVDGLVIPTPSPDPGDFVAEVDNPWLPLTARSSWEYVDTATSPRVRTISLVQGTEEIAGIETTALRTITRVARGETTVAVDYYAQDESGNVWWFGREGEWQAGEDGAQAGLAMAAQPRVGDGYREAYAAGVVDRRAQVLGLDDHREVPEGEYDDLVTIATTSPLTGIVEHAYYAEGVGLVLLETVEGEPEKQLGLVAYDEP